MKGDFETVKLCLRRLIAWTTGETQARLKLSLAALYDAEDSLYEEREDMERAA